MKPWHSQSRMDVLKELRVDPAKGLSAEEAERRREQYGANSLEQHKKESLIARFLGQMKDPMIIVLLVAAVLSLIASGGREWIDSVIILLIVIVNAVISISQEDSAEKSLEALRKMAAPLAKVLRGGQVVRTDTTALVPGDIILLEAGDLVPADARILECSQLKADESAMTGESVPVSKLADDGLPEDTVLGDRKNMVISATVITNGRATCVVTGTGMDTEVGRIAGMLMDEAEGTTPLQRRLAEISKVLSLVCLAVCVVMFGVGLLQHKPLLEMFMTAVSLAVAAIPEGLPAVVTIVLAMGVSRMVKHNAIVKKLPAVETLGCASVICTDKTGTLTQNRMTVVEVWTPEQKFRDRALAIGAMCNDTKIRRSEGETVYLGDPTETAFVSKAMEEGIDKDEWERRAPRVAEVPFDSDRKKMTTVHPRPEDGYRVLVKGAPDVLLSACTQIITQDGAAPMSDAQRAQISHANEEMAEKALRVLGVAYKDIKALPQVPEEQLTDWYESDLIFVGLVGMIDPPRMEVKDAVAQCYAAGIRPVMITGDHKTTAVAIARELDIFRDGDLAITGADLDFMTQEMLEADVAKFSVYARVSPEHKMRIVRAWQKQGKIVAMTGDGVNDAPALKAADIGCAMGITGTDVAKGAAEMILTDDNFATIVHAVEQGRGIYANIKKAIHYLLSANIGEIITIFVATVLGFHQMPLVPVQLLWLNLVTDSLPALALGVEAVEEGVMRQKPRRADESLFSNGFAFRLGWQGVMVAALTLISYWMGEYVLSDPAVADATACTMAFATLTFCELFHAFNVRSEFGSIFHIGVFTNSAMNKAFLVGLVMQLAVMLIPPLQGIFNTCPLDAAEWGVVIATAIAPIVICEIVKIFQRRRRAAEN